jgi:hypothetical protein
MSPREILDDDSAICFRATHTKFSCSPSCYPPTLMGTIYVGLVGSLARSRNAISKAKTSPSVLVKDACEFGRWYSVKKKNANPDGRLQCASRVAPVCWLYV